MTWEVLFFLILRFPFFGNTYKIVIDFNFLEKGSRTLQSFMAPKIVAYRN